MLLLLVVAAVALGLLTLLVGAGYALHLAGRGIRPLEYPGLWSLILREVASHVVLGPLMLVALGPPPPPPGPSARVPVLLVHGYALNRGCWRYLERGLRERGWDAVWAITHEPRSAGVPVFARRLAQAIDQLCASTGAEQIDLVAHSMGGIISGWALRRLGCAHRVRRLVTLGTPWAGTATALFGLRAEARDLEPRSPTLAEAADPPVPVVALWSRGDHIVFPVESAAPPWARCIAFDNIGHTELLFSEDILDEVAATLSAPEAARHAG